MFATLLLAAAAPQPAALKPVCQDTRVRQIAEADRGRVRPLTSEPPAQQYRTVLRTENGCQVPVKVSEQRRGHAPR